MPNLIAIVGRPNVGKSTLFNRLIEQKKAITESEPGVTRDRHYGSMEWCGRNFSVIDTGGYVKGSEEIFEKEIRSQVHIAISEANLLMFVVDAKDGLTGFDKEIAGILRESKKPVLLVANKCDNFNFEMNANEFYSLGLGKIFPISAISGYGTGELLDTVAEKLPTSGDEETQIGNDIPRISIIGRPNVGKSSFLNVLMGEDRSIVTPMAGTTRDSIDTHYSLFNKNFIITDTAGIRKKNKMKGNIEFYSTIRSLKTIESSDIYILMVDSTQGLEAQDIQLITNAERHKKGILIVVNKWDLIEKDHSSLKKYEEMVRDKISHFKYIPIIFTSTVKKQRILKAIEVALEIYKNRSSKIPTSKLNEILLKSIENYPPPANKGKYIKIKYITQLPTKTPMFAFFCNLPQYIKMPYKNYLENQIRKNFNFTGVPLKLIFRKK